MRVRKFEAETMQKALEAVKRELGRDAVILHTCTKRKNGFLGLWGKEMVEITASDDIKLIEMAHRPKNRKPFNIKKYEDNKVNIFSRDLKPPRMNDPADISVLKKEIDEMKSILVAMAKKNDVPDISTLDESLADAYVHLVEQEVSVDLSKDIIAKINKALGQEKISDRRLVKEVLHKTIVKMFRSIDPIEVIPGKLKKVALIGPTGVGKTTTIAKLAANFALKEKKCVALITADTYRIAAVEQLRTYADIINIPLEVVLSPNEVKRAIVKHSDVDLILIDTAGRSQKNRLQMQELKAYIDAIEPDETHLVLSVTSNQKTLQDTIDRFSEISVDKIIFTKLDEAVAAGIILNVISKLDKSLSYITTGQNVPEDIAVTDPNLIADFIVRGEN